VAVVNEVFARKYFPGASPLGRRFAVEGKVANIEIIGVSKAVRHQSLTQEIPPAAYLSYGQDTANIFAMNYEVRTAGDPLALAESVRKLVREADSRIPVADIDTQERVINDTIAQQRTFAALCTGFAVLALVIACVGLYGTMAYSVARRTSEIGIRMSLGAQRARVVRMVLRDVILLAGAGLAVGLPVALSLSHVVQSWMFGMKAADPLVMVGAPAVLLAAALAAGYGPARRASRVDPWTALRHE
jgi:ABC-type antimicrobial peptide transport system permease subunit